HVDEDVLRDRQAIEVAPVAAQGRFGLATAVAEVPRLALEARPGGAANLGKCRERAREFRGLGHGAYYTPVVGRSLGTLQRLGRREHTGRGQDMSGNGASARGVKQIGYFDCAGGGQVVVDGRVAYVAHMKAPHGTTIVDVGDPANPRQLASIDVPPGTHSHKVRRSNGLMLVNA